MKLNVGTIVTMEVLDFAGEGLTTVGARVVAVHRGDKLGGQVHVLLTDTGKICRRNEHLLEDTCSVVEDRDNSCGLNPNDFEDEQDYYDALRGK